jgi:hypothetical protein
MPQTCRIVSPHIQVGEKVLMGSWVVGKSSYSGCTSRFPFMVRLHNDPNPKVWQNVKVKNMKSCRMNQKAQKNLNFFFQEQSCGNDVLESG